MTDVLECPYCEKEQNEPDDCFDDNRSYFTNCDHCGKKFKFTVEHFPYYDSYKVPCNDGGPHKWQFMYTHKEQKSYKCMYCGAIEWNMI